MKRQTKHVVFGLLFTIMAGAGVVAQAQQPCPVDCPPKPICAPVVEAPKPVEVVCAPQPVCAPVVQAPQPVVVTQTKQPGILTGTYRLDPSRSDSVHTALTTISQTQCGCQQQVSHLDTPEMLAIDQNGQCVTIASSTGPQVAVVADGQLVPDATRRVSTQSTLQEGDALFIRTYSEHERDRNFTVTFTPTDDGVCVTRYINTDDPTKPLVIKSYYARTSDVAQLNLYDSAAGPRHHVVYSGNFVVPNGASLVAALDSALDTSLAREGDRFTMTVSSPSEYDGAVIEGFFSDIGGAGQAALNFERIRLSDGRVFDFAAEIVSVGATDGTPVQVSSGAWANEQERQAQQNLVHTSQSAAIGAVVGTLPVSGPGTGVNMIYTSAGGALKLGSGTEFVLRAASPRTI
jgi:hypothetical protein